MIYALLVAFVGIIFIGLGAILLLAQAVRGSGARIMYWTCLILGIVAIFVGGTLWP